MLDLSAAQKEAIKKRIRRACCDMARKMGMSASFTGTGIRIAKGSVAYVFDFKWNPLSNMWDLYHGETWLASQSQYYPQIIAYVMARGVPDGH